MVIRASKCPAVSSNSSPQGEFLKYKALCSIVPKNQQNLILIFDIIVYNSGREIRDQLKVRNGYVKTGVGIQLLAINDKIWNIHSRMCCWECFIIQSWQDFFKKRIELTKKWAMDCCQELWIAKQFLRKRKESFQEIFMETTKDQPRLALISTSVVVASENLTVNKNSVWTVDVANKFHSSLQYKIWISKVSNYSDIIS